MNSALFATSRGIVMKYHISVSKGLAITAAALFLWGCGNANSNAPAFGVSGHPANWLDKHRPAVLAKGSADSCKECHGADLLGGIAKTSCAECHAIPVFPFTPANHGDPNWYNPAIVFQLHGAAAKARPSLTNTGINQGFSMCQSCHGADFKGGVTNPKTTCFDCHVNAPHPDAPWFDATGTDVTHTNTDPANAAVCALCHTHGRNLSIPILTHYATGTPGCFNSTLCHGNVSPHAFPYPGSVHSLVAVAPFTDCLVCHTDSGGVYPVPASTPPDCRGCHKKASPGVNGCGSCHGPLAGDGRPNGTAFPDVAGAHNAGDHPLFACTDCHGNAAGSGQPTHGPSNGTAHHDVNVVISFSVNTHFTRTGNGHGTCTSDCHDAPSEVRTW
jgi:hypothetical protein